MEDVTLGLAFIAGILSFVSPCVLPLVPAYVGYMGGRATRNIALETGAKQKFGEQNMVIKRANMLLHGMAFVLGFTFVFVLIGLMTTAFVGLVGSSVNILTEVIGRVGGVVIIIFGLHFMGALRAFFNWLKKNPSTLSLFPVSILLVALITLAIFGGLIFGLMVGGAYLVNSVLGINVSPILVNILMLVIGLGIFAYAITSGKLSSLFATMSKISLGRIPTTILVMIGISFVIQWAFVVPIAALPALVGFILWFVLGGAFTNSEAFWLDVLNKIEITLYSDTRVDMEQNGRGGLGGSFIMGVVFSAGWTPCIGPLLGTILTVAAQTGEVGQAIPMLTAYSLGLGIPFMLTAVLMEGAQAILRRLQKHMARIEFISGSLLIIIGIMVGSGTLQNLSSSLSAEQADVSLRIEECGLGFVRGDMSFGQAQSCLDGTLHPIALGQSAAGELNTEVTENTYLIQLEEAQLVDIELSRVDTIFPAQVVITNDAGDEIATGNDFIQIDDTKYVVLPAIELPAGRYTVTITQTGAEAVTFRLKVREAEPIETMERDEESVIQAPPRLNSITDLAASSGATVGLDIGNRAPDFTITTLDGEEVALSDLRGQVVLLNFWGTWCPPCIREMPEFQEAYEEYSDNDFTILALAILRESTSEQVYTFRDEFELTFPIAVDENDTITNLYDIVSQPSTIIIDKEGIIVYKNFGITLASQIGDILTSILNG